MSFCRGNRRQTGDARCSCRGPLSLHGSGGEGGGQRASERFSSGNIPMRSLRLSEREGSLGPPQSQPSPGCLRNIHIRRPPVCLQRVNVILQNTAISLEFRNLSSEKDQQQKTSDVMFRGPQASLGLPTFVRRGVIFVG